MGAIIINSLREKIRSKTIYIVGGIGVAIILFLALNGSFSFDDKILTDCHELVPIVLVMVNLFASILAIMLSLSTIPKEFERKTTHLVLVRGIKQWQFILALTISNIIISLFSIGLLSISVIIYALVQGEIQVLLKILGSILILGLNISVLSAITSWLSIKLPETITGFIGILIYFVGVFHSMLSIFVKTREGFSRFLLEGLMTLVPNFAAVQKQSGQLVTGNYVDIYPLVLQGLFLYIILALTFVTFRKEV
ncbi:hypothetical protein GOQ27_07970 [Clostridium sp. D2Q-11]|uniref:ABC-2 family transporter protein n=1 Tax=Anaeromonas frigoriresistens TaxID=2683708 RepID=A0A942USM5_9FIRM|nr:hypothetical protein [Anaeromonas frigoriresistens]MBS4538398.1 hypothetical protein [Anaeromonas frigoriresistens]